MRNNKTIIIVSLLMILSTIVYSQNITIRGNIKDKTNNKPLPFINIYFAKTTVGTITNNSGEFILYVNKKTLPDTLVFSCIGYFTKKIKISSMKDTLINIKLKPKIFITQTVEIKAKKNNPSDIFKKTYNFYKAHQKDTFLVDFYTREVIKYNNKFVYEAKGFLKGYMSEKISLSDKTKLIKGNLIANDSLLYLYGDTIPVNESPPFYSVWGLSGIGKMMKKIQKNKHKKLNIDTVLVNDDEKLYVLHFYNDKYFIDNKHNSIDLLLNDGYMFNYLKKQKQDDINSQFEFIFYIENKKDVYLVKKIKILHPFGSSEHPSYFYEEYNYISNENNEIIPNYTNILYGYMQNDTALYTKYSDCIVTSIQKTHTVDKINFKNIFGSFPTYLLEKKHNEDLNQKSNLYTPGLNYIKEDTIEKLIKKDLYGKVYYKKN